MTITVAGAAAAVAIVVVLLFFYHRYRVEHMRMKILLDLLNDDQWEWRTLQTLQNAVGLDVKATKKLLTKIGARTSTSDSRIWTIRY